MRNPRAERATHEIVYRTCPLYSELTNAAIGPYINPNVASAATLATTTRTGCRLSNSQ